MEEMPLGGRRRAAREGRLARQRLERRGQPDQRPRRGSRLRGRDERDRTGGDEYPEGAYAGLIVIVTVVRSRQSWFIFTWPELPAPSKLTSESAGSCSSLVTS